MRPDEDDVLAEPMLKLGLERRPPPSIERRRHHFDDDNVVVLGRAAIVPAPLRGRPQESRLSGADVLSFKFSMVGLQNTGAFVAQP